MAIHRTAMGKSVDMASLSSKNELTRAVGNMSVNARGDTIDAHGRITQSATTKVNELYSQTVGNRSAQVRSRVNTTPTPDVAPVAPAIDPTELNAIELELDSNLDEELEIEAIKAAEVDVAKTKPAKK